MRVRAIGEIEAPDEDPHDIARLDRVGQSHVGAIEISR